MGGFFWIATVFFSSCPYEHSECTQPTAWASGVKFAQVLKTILFPGQSLCRHTLQTWMACFIKISFLCSKVAASDFSCFCISLLITPAVSVVNIITFLVPWSYKKQTLMFFSVWFHLAMLKSQLPQYSILHNTHKKKKKRPQQQGQFQPSSHTYVQCPFSFDWFYIWRWDTVLGLTRGWVLWTQSNKLLQQSTYICIASALKPEH